MVGSWVRVCMENVIVVDRDEKRQYHSSPQAVFPAAGVSKLSVSCKKNRAE